MSSSRKRTEHIERIRYPNPLSLPPYPPKLLSIPTPSSRYADPRTFGTRLANAQPLPVVVDSEAGMPLNMTDFPQAWYTDQEIEADDNLFPRLESADDVDDEDAFLLSDLLGKLPATVKGTGAKEVDKGQITWLRRTEYLGAEKKKRERELIASRSMAEKIDSSREGQLARIKASFAMANQQLSSVRHPTRPGLKAVEEHRLLPDPETWATRYDVFRFGDFAGRNVDNKPLVDPRLQAAILRPHKDSIDRDIMSLFLVSAPPLSEAEGRESSDLQEEAERPKKAAKLFRSREEEAKAEDEETERLVKRRREGEATDGEVQDLAEVDAFDVQYDDEDERVHLNYTRDYEPHDETSRKDQELVFTFIDGGSSDSAGNRGQLPPAVFFEHKFRSKRPLRSNGTVNGAANPSKSPGVVYYHPISTRASLRVRRRRAMDPKPPEHWDAISLGKRTLSMYEKIERIHERKEVDDMAESNLPERVELPQEAEEDAEGEEDHQAAHLAEMDEAATAAREEQEEGETKQVQVNGSEADDAGDDDDEDEGMAKQDLDGNGSESGSESGSDEASKSDEDMDDDELAALQADAGDAEQDAGGETRRSRRGARTVEAGTDAPDMHDRPMEMDDDDDGDA